MVRYDPRVVEAWVAAHARRGTFEERRDAAA
jgi:hypothetical protein